MLRKLLVVGLVLGVAFALQAKTVKAPAPDYLNRAADVSPTAGKFRVALKMSQIEQNLGDSIWGFDAQGPTGDNQLLGVEFDGTYFWVTGGNSGNDPNKLYKYDANGNFLEVYDQPSSCTGWGWRDLTWDGEYLYASCSYTIHQIDPATGQPTGTTINGPENPNRALAYDPSSDHFFTANFSSPIYEFDRSGSVINTWANSYSIYGMAWDDISEGGPYLWISAQEDNGVGGYNVIYQFDPASGTYTGVYFPVTTGDPTAYAGGLAFTDEWDPTMGLLFELQQATPNDLVIGYYVTEARKSYLIIDLDQTPLTGPWLDSLFTSLGYVGTYTTDTLYFDSLSNYMTLWITCGMYDQNGHIQQSWGDKIAQFLENGGKLYLEGGDVFVWDATSYWDPNPYTGTIPLDDGGDDLDSIIGVANDLIPWVEGDIWTYTGENSYVDRIMADTLPPNGGYAQEVLLDINDNYFTGVAYEQGTWRTFALSSELGGYEGTVPAETLAQMIMNFLMEGPPVHDVGVSAIVEPSEPVPVGTSITPEVTVKNFGDFPESNFDVTFEIYYNGSSVYTNTQTITTTINPGDQTNVTFDSWTPGDAGSYELVAYTSLAGDADPTNDTATGSFMAYAFIKDYLILDLDLTPITGSLLNGYFVAHGLSGDYVIGDPSYLDSLLFYSSIWICLGMFPNNYSLTMDDVMKIKTYLEAGGMAYVEGGDCWGFDASRTLLDSLFGINYACTNDGQADLYVVAGQSNSIVPQVAGQTWNYGGENNWVDELCIFPSPPYGGTAEIYLKNQSTGDNIGILYNQGTWKTVAHSFEMGGLTPGTATFEDLVAWFGTYHFGFPEVSERTKPNAKIFALYNASPNPAKGKVTFTFSIPRKSNVSLKVYDASGRLVKTIAEGTYNPGVYKVTWNGRDMSGRKVAQGVYFYKLVAGSYKATRKVIFLR